MLFNSLAYIFIFLPIVVMGYYFWQNLHLAHLSKIWLIASSIVFYGYYDPKYTLLLLVSMLVNFSIGCGFNKGVFHIPVRRKCLLIVGLSFNILLLGYYKYANFFIDNVNILFRSDIQIQKIILPLGISFFTFTQIAYLVDEYKEKAKEYNFIDYLLFVTFFPHLIAGPILRHNEVIPQFNEIKRKVFRYKNLVLGIFLFSMGLFKKVVFADTFSTYVNNGYNPERDLTMLEGWIVVLSYTLQIYFDFSGYTDMALGSAKMLNIDLPINFNSPYKAESIQDFWRRWHITLSTFLRDYVYIPLGGNRKGSGRTYLNLLLTMLIGGVWHGAGWLFVLWGGLHGLALCVNRFWKKTKINMPKWAGILVTFIFINATWIIFRAESFWQVRKILHSLVDYHNFVIPRTFTLSFKFLENRYENILLLIPLGVLVIFVLGNSNQILSKIKLDKKSNALILSVAFALLFMTAIIKGIAVPYTEFIYFNF